jgi:hypothetical protein
MIALGIGVFLVGVKLFKPVPGSVVWIDRGDFPNYIDEFWTRIGRYFWPIYAVALKGYDWTAVSSVMAWETGYLSDPNAKRRVTIYNNCFGIEPSGKAGKYSDVAACVRYFDYMMHVKEDTRGLYAEAYRVRGDGESFIIELWKAGYNSNTSWRDGVLSIYRDAIGGR